MLHTHSFICHQRCIKLFYQYFSFPCQYHSTSAPYPFIHLPPTLHNVFLPVLQCQYHSTSAPYSLIHLLPTQYNFFFSQYFSFPLTVSFHQCSIRFPLPTPTQNNVFLPVLQFPLPISFQQCSVLTFIL